MVIGMARGGKLRRPYAESHSKTAQCRINFKAENEGAAADRLPSLTCLWKGPPTPLPRQIRDPEIASPLLACKGLSEREETATPKPQLVLGRGAVAELGQLLSSSELRFLPLLALPRWVAKLPLLD